MWCERTANWIRMRVYFGGVLCHSTNICSGILASFIHTFAYTPNLSPEIESSNKTTSVCLIKVFGLQFRCYSSCCMLFFTCLFFVFQFSWFPFCLLFLYVNCVPYSSFATRFRYTPYTVHCTTHYIPTWDTGLKDCVSNAIFSLWSFNQKHTNEYAQCANLFALLYLEFSVFRFSVVLLFSLQVYITKSYSL